MIIKTLISGLNMIIKALGGIATVLIMLLPTSPFKAFSSISIPYLDTLNWVLPISFMVTILGYWVGAIALYYVIQVVLRWIKIIE